MDFQDKTILFYGPADTKDKETISPDDFDFTIITNNMVNLFFKKYSIQQTKVILLTNCLFTKKYFQGIHENHDKLYGYIVINNASELKIKNNLKNIKPMIKKNFSLNGKVPLGLTRVLNILEGTNFKRIYITEVTFYSDTRGIQHNYETNYLTPLGKKYNIFVSDKNLHNIKDNINFFKKFMRKYENKVEICDEAKNKL